MPLKLNLTPAILLPRRPESIIKSLYPTLIETHPANFNSSSLAHITAQRPRNSIPNPLFKGPKRPRLQSECWRLPDKMEPISVISAKAIWLINTNDLNPRGLRIMPQLSEALIDAYDFDAPPEDEAQSTSMKLKNGLFEKDGEAYRVGLEIYDDGFVGDSSSSTALTEAFLAHALEWAKTNFDINFDATLLMKKVYSSEIVVRFKSPLATACTAFSQFADLLSKYITAPGTAGFALSAITFSSRVPVGNNPTGVLIERRANTGPEANVFYCKAPLTTDAFIELLSTLDELLAKQPL